MYLNIKDTGVKYHDNGKYYYSDRTILCEIEISEQKLPRLKVWGLVSQIRIHNRSANSDKQPAL